MKKFALAMLLPLSALLVASPASASIVFQTSLSGANESPANSSTGTGMATVTLMDDLNTLSVSFSFSGLSAPANAGHIHCCTSPGMNAPVVLPFAGIAAATSGTFNQTYNLSTAGVLSGITEAAFIAGLEAGDAYVNIHNANYPAGEIRGFLQATPEPSTVFLMSLPLAGILVFRRKSLAASIKR